MDIERHIGLTKASREFVENWEQDVAGVMNDEGDGKTLDITTDEEREEIGLKIKHCFEFIREILNDPTILELMPSGSKVDAVFKDQRDAAEHYDNETRRMVAKVTPPHERAE